MYVPAAYNLAQSLMPALIRVLLKVRGPSLSQYEFYSSITFVAASSWRLVTQMKKQFKFLAGHGASAELTSLL